MVFLIATIALLLIAFACGTGLFCYAFVRNKNDGDCNMDSEVNRPIIDYREVIEAGMQCVSETPHKRVYTKSFDGLKLAASYYECEGSDRTMILFHGYRSAAKRDFSCAIKMYGDMGLNVLLVDQRAHGESEGRIITFGIKERRDVLSWCNFVLQNFGQDNKLYLGGMSMGSATVLMSLGLKLPPNVKAVVSDCGYTSPCEIISSVAKRYMHIKSRLAVPFLNVFCRIYGGFSLYEASAPECLKSTEIPVLFIHGTEDAFVPCDMTEQNYAAAHNKEILLVEGANHGTSYLVDRVAVTDAVERFLRGH